MPGIKFGAVYIAPRDSPFYDPKSFAQLQAHIHQESVFIMGDFNARMGDLSRFNEPAKNIRYSNNDDVKINQHGRDLAALCKNYNLLPINHLIYKGHSHDGKLTFRRKNKWISQLDWIICSCNLLHHIDVFRISQNTEIPSDHAPLTLEISRLAYSPHHLLSCAKELGAYDKPEKPKIKRPIKYKQVNCILLQTTLPFPSQQMLRDPDINNVSENIADIIYKTAKESEENHVPIIRHSPKNAMQRWQKLLQYGNDQELWASINWKGELNKTIVKDDRPSDVKFCEHFEQLLNPHNTDDAPQYHPTRYIHIPVLDDPIQTIEVDRCMNKLKSGKAAGVDGIAPGVLKMLPDNWIVLLTQLFNAVFYSDYPQAWTRLKVFTIYKKGLKNDPGNYRGISILNSIAKLYDMVLSQRFALWYSPRIEQAGAQSGRGCEEQILTIRLLIDIARHKKKTLFIAYIDYQKAYDNVQRYKLMQYLDQRGCGTQFLMALQKSLKSTGIIGESRFRTSQGVKQGGSTSCKLFTAYIDPTVDAVNTCGNDDWLGNLHILLLMDDTVVFASSRATLCQKLDLLKRAADNIGMKIHPTKSQFMAVNSNDIRPIDLPGARISHTTQYTYLGANISNDSIADQIKTHISNKQKHVIKFYSFLAKNSDCPYKVKHKVWQSALNATILYGCETWCTKNLRPVETQYNSSLKQLLAVRQTTCNDVIFAETGETNASTLVTEKQIRFFKKIKDRPVDYVSNTINLAIASRAPMGKYMRIVMDNEGNYPTKLTFKAGLQANLLASQSSKRMTYKAINPTLQKFEPMTAYNIPEHHRIALTRLRTGSHNLKCETGRWARIPPEQRLCPCGTGVQNEEHVLLKCPKSDNLRQQYHIQYDVLHNLFEHEIKELAKYCYKTLIIYRT